MTTIDKSLATSETLDIALRFIAKGEAELSAREVRRWQDQNIPFFIDAYVHGTFDLTPVRNLKHEGACFTCGTNCPKKETPVYVYQGNGCEYWFCETCLKELKEGVEQASVCRRIAEVESDINYAKHIGVDTSLAEQALEHLRRNVDATVIGELPAELQERLDKLYIARNVEFETT